MSEQLLDGEVSNLLVSNIRGRHASNESMIIVRGVDGKGEYVRNLNTRIDPSTTELTFVSACEGTVCLRIDDKLRSDFWTEFNLDVATLEWLLAKAKETAAVCKECKGSQYVRVGVLGHEKKCKACDGTGREK